MKTQEKHQLLHTLEARFGRHLRRHPGVAWARVQAKLGANAHVLQLLKEMEETGGEPDVIGRQGEDGRYKFCDCAAESPHGRRSLCYDRAALDARKEAKPSSSAIEMAAAMDIEILTEDEYRELQSVGEFDLKTSSWIRTPPEVRKIGGALFCDRRYGRVFTYHNGAQSYYAARGFRGLLRV